MDVINPFPLPSVTSPPTTYIYLVLVSSERVGVGIVITIGNERIQLLFCGCPDVCFFFLFAFGVLIREEEGISWQQQSDARGAMLQQPIRCRVKLRLTGRGECRYDIYPVHNAFPFRYNGCAN